ncbi:MAG: ATP-binding cassette domain-containing protein [Oscillospiraceae bacterium]|nr:ATP-binding cassette domain-containing protein [Oscillospiraceae bacterium]
MQTFTITDLSFTYPTESVPALQNVSLSIEAGSFTVLCGRSGCGKSTLLRQLKPILQPHGTQTGTILFEGKSLSSLSQRTQSARIGFVLQNLDAQLVTDKVWHELAFGLESLGLSTPVIRRRVAEIASFFGIQNWFYKPVCELSGGQKQLVNLASVMALEPSVLLLDEPTSQLDPIAATDFLSTLGRINRELGTTIILSEHRLEDALALSTNVVFLERGRILDTGTASEVGSRLKAAGSDMFSAMPVPMRIYAGVPNDLPCPVTVAQGRQWLQAFSETHPLCPVPPAAPSEKREGPAAVELDEAFFRYDKQSPDVVKALTLRAYPGELLAILGGNGTGKSTTMGLISGIHRAYRGKVSVLGTAPQEVSGKIALLPQDPQTLFVKNTVIEDLLSVLDDAPRDRRKALALEKARLCELMELLERHPYDLSGGEQQRAALCKVLLREPEVLLLDEPTKGLDAEFKRVFARMIRRLCARGVCVIMVSHDAEFCASYASRCAMFFDGAIVAEGTPREFFSSGSFYTTSASRMARGLLPGAITPEDVIAACGGEVPPEPDLPADGDDAAEIQAQKEAREQTKTYLLPSQTAPLPLWRKLLGALGGLGALICLWRILSISDLSELLTQGGLTSLAGDTFQLYLAMLACLLVLAVSFSRAAPQPVHSSLGGRPLSGRTKLASVLSLLLVPLTIFIGIVYFGKKSYGVVSILVLLECMAPFALIFEGRKPKARELVLIAALCALAVAGRAALFMLPGFKPVAALVILSGVAFGGETGFLVGAMSMLTSNVLFGQGPWTPFQMFAMGLIGFLAGVSFQKGLLRAGRVPLAIFGAVSVVLVYGGIMNPASAILYQPNLSLSVLKAYYLTGFPFDLVHAAATALFLWFGAEPMLEKLERVKRKYGLTEAE